MVVREDLLLEAFGGVWSERFRMSACGWVLHDVKACLNLVFEACFDVLLLLVCERRSLGCAISVFVRRPRLIPMMHSQNTASFLLCIVCDDGLHSCRAWI
jgi:hypothetical protein